LTSFKEHFAKSNDEFAAAEKTFTGKMALKHGFKIKEVNYSDIDEVTVLFIRK
jgi:hypothetical protein